MDIKTTFDPGQKVAILALDGREGIVDAITIEVTDTGWVPRYKVVYWWDTKREEVWVREQELG